MTRRRPLAVLAGAAVLSLVALALATYGGGGAAAATTSPATHASTANVATLHAARTKLGTILVDSHGHTLYLFKADKGKKSACSGACAVAWPPLTVHGKPTAGAGARASLIGTIRRSNGAAQVTYNGHPLYRFVNARRCQRAGRARTGRPLLLGRLRQSGLLPRDVRLGG